MSPMSGKLYVSLCKSHFRRTDVFKYSRSSRRKQWGLRNSVLSYFYCIIMLTEEKKKTNEPEPYCTPNTQEDSLQRLQRRKMEAALPSTMATESLFRVCALLCFVKYLFKLEWGKKRGGDRNILYFTKLGLHDSLEQNLFKKWNKNLIFISRIPQLFSHIKSFST